MLLTLVACSDSSPACPATGKAELAPSAGCFATSDQRLLMVQGLNGEISLPGGSSQPGESAQCTAFRETWEETGLRLQPRELLEVFDTGFHLYRCEHDALSGVIDPPLRFEVRAVRYLSADQFHTYEWRFKEQQQTLKNLLFRQSGMTPE